MPAVTIGNRDSRTRREKVNSIKSVSYDYNYPDDLKLKPGTPFHDKLATRLWQRANEAHNAISNRFETWNSIDKTLTTYIDLTADEEDLKDSGRPVSIVFPNSYAILETMLSYMVMAFFQDPIFRYVGNDPNSTIGAMLLQRIIHQQCEYNKVPLALHTMFRDNFAYGLGAVVPTWKVQHGKKPVVNDIYSTNWLGQQKLQNKEIVYEDAIIHEGNALENIDPYLFLPDPNVPIDRTQDGEFIGWINRTNLMDLLSRELVDEDMFNVRYLKHLQNGETSLVTDLPSDRGLKTNRTGTDEDNYASRVDVINMYVKIIPKEWELGDNEYPEIWSFELAGDTVITKARELGAAHGRFPVAVTASEYDGYSNTPISRIEVMDGLQGVMNFLFNCYDENTEVLTSDGWKLISDAKESDSEVATVDIDTKSLSFEKPSEWFEYDYSGEMIHFKTKRHDIMVTPNHNMFGRYRYDTLKEGEHFREANTVFERSPSSEFKIPTTASWDGNDIGSFVFDEILHKKNIGSKLRYPKKVIDPNTMFEFLGWLVTDGSICNGNKSGSFTVSVKQSKSYNFDKLDDLFERMKFHFTRCENDGVVQWSITDKRLYNWIQEHCYIGEGTTGVYQCIPKFVKNADIKLLNIFYESMILGDGSRLDSHPNLVKFGAESEQLCDDLQEICVRLGYSSIKRTSETTTGKPFWYVQINENGPDSTSSKKTTKKVNYEGKVYCFTNSTHLTVVRRNGKIALCGQSHISNVRKAMNDMFVVDPYLVNINDLKDPKPGKLIRMRRPAWGRGVQHAVQQLGVTDITRGNMVDTGLITQLMQTLSGTDNPVMGNLRQGGPERLTSAEFQGTMSGAVNRLERVARISSYQGMQDIALMFASNTQQLMEHDTYIQTVGQWPEILRKTYNVTNEPIPISPYDLIIDYQVSIRDGSIPGGNFSQAWIQLYQILSGNPELTQKFDMVRIFKHIATNLGAKNVNNFERQAMPMVSTAPDEQVAAQAQQGNLVPIEGVQ